MKKFLVVILLIFLSCKNETKIENVKKKHISRIDTLTEISFRRSYVDHQDLTKKELDELYKSNPYLEDYTVYKQKTKLFNELKKIKVLEGNENDISLYTNRFEGIYSKDVKYLDSEKKISFKYSSDFTKSNSIEIQISKNNVLTKKKVDFGGDNFIGMILEDIDNDGVKEILILLNFYVMNGDNYILTIYKFVE
jgi:hypothetical protein